MKIHWQNIAIVLASLLFVSVFARPVYAEDKPDACPTAEDAQDTNTIIENAKKQLLRLNSSHFLDQTGTLVPNEIVTQDFNSSPCETNIQPPLPGEALWLRFSVQNENDHPINWGLIRLTSQKLL